jgi:8-oxo-dGTP pyrophosphatase MutT (NUDIX family)
MTEPQFTVVGSQHHYRGWVIDVHTDEVRMPDGTIAKRDVVDHPGAVAVLALDEHDNVVMVRQYRHPVREHLLELPAGLLDLEGEDALTAAKRELHEEAAITALEWWVLLDLHTSPGMTSEAIRVYLARGLISVPDDERFTAAHEEITMTVEYIALDQAVAMALSGELTNGPAVAGVLAAQIVRSQNWASLRPADALWAARPDRTQT